MQFPELGVTARLYLENGKSYEKKSPDRKHA